MEHPSGGAVGWVVGTWYVVNHDGRIMSVEEGVDSAEDEVRLDASTASVGPALDDTLVVSMYEETLSHLEPDEGPDE